MFFQYSSDARSVVLHTAIQTSIKADEIQVIKVDEYI